MLTQGRARRQIGGPSADSQAAATVDRHPVIRNADDRCSMLSTRPTASPRRPAKHDDHGHAGLLLINGLASCPRVALADRLDRLNSLRNPGMIRASGFFMIRLASWLGSMPQ